MTKKEITMWAVFDKKKKKKCPIFYIDVDKKFIDGDYTFHPSAIFYEEQEAIRAGKVSGEDVEIKKIKISIEE